MTEQLRFSDGYYRSVLEQDAKLFGLEAPPTAELARPFVYSQELEQPRRLKPDTKSAAPIETAHLRITPKVVKAWAATSEGAGFRYEHTVLEITNKSPKFIAYRVTTGVDHPERCSSKGAIPHNAVALKPGETVQRTECLWRPNSVIDVKAVEVVEVPELSYYYVSRLTPSQLALDERSSEGHEIPKAKACPFVPWREIKSSGAEWADVIDFYGRHNCDEYSFFAGSRRWTAPGNLPAKARGELNAAAQGK